MRLSFQSLYTQCQSNTSATDATSLTYFKQQINTRYQLVLAQLADYQDIKTSTGLTVVGQQLYHNPPGYVNIESVSVTIGSVVYPLKAVDSALDWDQLNAVQFTGSAIPMYFFQKRDSFGIWPTPQGAYTITLNYLYRDRNMTQDDYSAGTASQINNSQIVTGLATTWTGAMVGRWFTATNYGYSYRITAASTTSLTLEEAIQDLTDNTLTYTIGETPELPEEAHELLSIGATADFYAGVRKALTSATWWNNTFWTGDGNNNDRTGKNVRGGLIGLQKRYASRSNSKIIRRRAAGGLLNSKLFATSIS
jgi:hypothetical protein